MAQVFLGFKTQTLTYLNLKIIEDICTWDQGIIVIKKQQKNTRMQ